MRTWEQYEYERYSNKAFNFYGCGNVKTAMQRVKILEDFLDIHPFPKHKHTAKVIKNIFNGST